ncbi:MAG: hypothetical protein Q6351_004460 [Candidatus Njordarchaeum guaymaensis]
MSASDRDHDIPDICDVEPDELVKRYAEKILQDQRLSNGYWNERVLYSKEEIPNRGRVSSDTTEYYSVERPIIAYIIPILYVIGFGGYIFYAFSTLGIVCWLAIGAIIAIALENIIANSIRKSPIILGIIGMGLAIVTIQMIGYDYFLLSVPIFVIFFGYMIQCLAAENEFETKGGLIMFLYHLGLVTVVEYIILRAIGIDLLSDFTLLGALLAGNIFNGIEGAITVATEDTVVTFGFLGMLIYAVVYIFIFSIPLIVLLIIMVFLIGVIIENIDALS